MVTEAIIWIFISLANLLISMFPEFLISSTEGIGGFFDLIGKASIFVDLNVFWRTVLTYITFYNLELTWGVIEWVYKKIPGVN